MDDSPESPHLRGGKTPERRRTPSNPQRATPQNQTFPEGARITFAGSADSSSRRRSPSQGRRGFSDPTSKRTTGKMTTADWNAHRAAQQAILESKYHIPDRLRFKLGDLETSVKPKLSESQKKVFRNNDADPVVLNQRAEKLAIHEPLVKVHGDPQRDPADAAKDGRVLDGVRSWLEEVVEGQVRVRPCGRDVGRELLGAWAPTRLRFNFPMPQDGTETGNEWFGAVWQDLYLKASHFAEEYFGEGLGFGEEVPNGGNILDVKMIDKVWTTGGVGSTKNLVWFISQVARQDNGFEGGWDVMLSKAVQRKLVVAGVIGKILERQVFDDLLFGADEQSRAMLEASDKALELGEGYRRTRLRSECIDMYMRNQELTPKFWEHVDQLSIQITTLLLPLLKLMDRNFNNSRVKSLWGFHQKIHDIVSEAGFLSLHMAHSKSIFRITAPFLGQTWAIDQNNVDDRVYHESSLAVARLEGMEKQKWAKENLIYESDPANYRPTYALWEKTKQLGFWGVLWAVLGFFPSLLYKKVEKCGGFPTWDSKPGLGDTVWRSPPYLAKVQIVVWPKCERYGLMGEIDPRLKTSTEGESISTLLKSQVVYYQGRTDPRGLGAEGTPTLLEWLRYKDALWFKKWWDRFVKLGVSLLVLYLLSRFAPVLWIIPQLGLALAKLVAILILDVIIWLLTAASNVAKAVMYLLSAVWYTILGALGFKLPSLQPSEPWVIGHSGYEGTVYTQKITVPSFEGHSYTVPWFGGGGDYEKRHKELEAEKEKARERARRRARELEKEKEKELEEDADDIEVTKVIDKIFPGPITPAPLGANGRRMTLKRSWTRAGEEPGPEVWEEHTPGYFELLTEKAKELPVFKGDKDKAKRDGVEAEVKEGEEWKKYVKPNWYGWFGGATEEELRQREEERLAFEAAQESARREQETRKERRKREREEAREKKLREAKAREKKELEEIQRKERELELEIARHRKDPKAPAKVRSGLKETLKKWWQSTTGGLGVAWQPYHIDKTIYYPAIKQSFGGDQEGEPEEL
ncbi:hypothetical protein QC762_0028690 [Podospora pseudocomata]|uniref:Uncharacterized protein n=1 Tax=Podospora pseudocomata TaxID=2093779 RepID=A0ABR0GSG3_9PEZI|nr:hypothetical protein QC762_0028690 [Podospora pseudocomata]